MSAHEDFGREEAVAGSSNRSFGLVFAAVFTVVALWPLLDGGWPRWWAAALAALFAVVATLRPAWLAPLNRYWTKLALLLHRVTNPLVMGVIFYAVVTPIALIMRALGKDPLLLRFDRQAASYWIERRPPGPAPESMRRQF